MARTNLTANRRAFRSNPRNFLDMVSKAPIEVTINDGVNPEYTISVDPVTNTIINQEALPPGVTLETERDVYNRERDENPIP